MPSNSAAYIKAAKAKPLEVGQAPSYSPGADEILIKTKAVAINPIDWIVQDTDMFGGTYPGILGEDVAGEVVEVGSNVTAFRAGQRVVANLTGLMTGNPAHGSFQNFCLANATLAAHIPANMSYEHIVVLPHALSAASAGLFEKDHLNLPHPDTNTAPGSTGTTILIWGGSSSVGGMAIQLAKAAGVDVFTTAGSHNHSYVKGLGADRVFDHTSPSVVDDIVSALNGKRCGGALDTISRPETITSCAEIVSRAGGNRRIAATVPQADNLPHGVPVAELFALTIVGNEVGPAVWSKYLPQALESGAFKVVPEPLIVGSGLDKIQEAMERSKAGVSARKIVVTL